MSWNGCRSRYVAMRGRRRDLGATRSTLLRQQTTGARAPASRASGRRVNAVGPPGRLGARSKPGPRPPGRAPPPAASSSPSRPCPACKPGVSTKITWACGRWRIPVIRVRVVWGRRETMAIFSPTSRLSNVDLPTFGRPTSATNPARCAAPVSAEGKSRPRAARVPAGAGRGPGSARARSCMRRACAGRASSQPARWRMPWITRRSSSSATDTPTAAACRAAVSAETMTSPRSGAGPGPPRSKASTSVRRREPRKRALRRRIVGSSTTVTCTSAFARPSAPSATRATARKRGSETRIRD